MLGFLSQNTSLQTELLFKDLDIMQTIVWFMSHGPLCADSLDGLSHFEALIIGPERSTCPAVSSATAPVLSMVLNLEQISVPHKHPS